MLLLMLKFMGKWRVPRAVTGENAEIYGQMEGATSRDGGDNPGDTIIPDIYRDVLTGQIGEIRSRSGSDVAKIRLGS